MISVKYRIVWTMIGWVLCSSAMAAHGNAMDLMYEFQYAQLMDPSNEQLQLEKEGNVFIYAGLKESDIQSAIDKHYDRMGSMMFVNVVWTDEAGNPLTDPDTGEAVVDSDC
ncbi:MAG TPA: hypothetical protein VIM41_04595 [Gammaproteobacteria bacterium]